MLSPLLSLLSSRTTAPARRSFWTTWSVPCRSSGTGLQTEVTPAQSVPFFFLFVVLYCPLQLPCYYHNFDISNLKVQLVYTTLILFSGALVFQLKKRPPDYQGRKGRKVDDKGMKGNSLPPEKLPYLVELSPGITITTSKYCFLIVSFPRVSARLGKWIMFETIFVLQTSLLSEQSFLNTRKPLRGVVAALGVSKR